MLCSLVYSALFATSLAYRVLEFTGKRCTGAQVGIDRLVEPSTCTALNKGISNSVLAKIDNFNNDKYTLKVHDTDDCTGNIIGSITGLNGCLNISQNTAGKAVQVIPVSSGHDTPNKGFVTDHQYNLASKNENVIKVPIMHAGFRTVQRSSRTENGTYLDESFDIFDPMTLEQLRELDEAWTVPWEVTATASTNETSLRSP